MSRLLHTYILCMNLKRELFEKKIHVKAVDMLQHIAYLLEKKNYTKNL